MKTWQNCSEENIRQAFNDFFEYCVVYSRKNNCYRLKSDYARFTGDENYPRVLKDAKELNDAYNAFMSVRVQNLETLHIGQAKAKALRAYVAQVADRESWSKSGESCYYYIHGIKVRFSSHARQSFATEDWAKEIGAFYDITTNAEDCDKLAKKLGIKFNGKTYEKI